MVAIAGSEESLSREKIKVLCTGGAGYIGSHTVIQLLSSGRFDCVLADDFSNASHKVVPALESVTGQKIRVVQIDLCNRDKVFELFEQEKFAAVIHYAAKKSVGESVAKPLEYYDVNMNSLFNVVYAMRKTNCNRLVFSSSACCYAAHPEGQISENCPTGPPNPYGWTKVMAEQVLSDCAVAYPELKIVSLRYFNPIGNIDLGCLGESPKDPQNLLPIIQQVAVGTRSHVEVFGNDWPTVDGTGVRDYLHVMDLADGHIAALDYLIKKQTGGIDIMNLGTGRGFSVLEMIKAFEEASGIKIDYKIVGRRPGDLAHVVADPSKANKILGWKAKRSINDACVSAWKWQKGHPNGFNE